MTVTDIFNALIGEWKLNRTITPGGTFEGTAVFEKKSDTVLEYTEIGVLKTDAGYESEAKRSYEWRLEGGDIVIYFNDGATKGQRFHALNFTEGADAAADHWCDPDQYDSEYSFADMPNGFTAKHDVKGPRKDYRTLSKYTR